VRAALTFLPIRLNPRRRAVSPKSDSAIRLREWLAMRVIAIRFSSYGNYPMGLNVSSTPSTGTRILIFTGFLGQRNSPLTFSRPRLLQSWTACLKASLKEGVDRFSLRLVFRRLRACSTWVGPSPLARTGSRRQTSERYWRR
jgi:hypothetical protein